VDDEEVDDEEVDNEEVDDEEVNDEEVDDKEVDDEPSRSSNDEVSDIDKNVYLKRSHASSKQ
jgi:hypothetical protein